MAITSLLSVEACDYPRTTSNCRLRGLLHRFRRRHYRGACDPTLFLLRVFLRVHRDFAVECFPASLRRRAPGQISCRPCPLEIEASDAAVAVEGFAGQVKVWHLARLHGAEIDLAQRHATGRHLGVVPSAVLGDGEE